MNALRFGAQLCRPSKILCIGRNFVAHAKELGNRVDGEMLLFAKPNSAITGDLRAAHRGDELSYEAEICFGMEDGRFCYVGLGLDLTKRALQAGLQGVGLPWERCKSFDGSALFSDFAPLADASAIGQLGLKLSVDEVLAQEGLVQDMVHKPLEILEEIRRVWTLEDYDVVMTGTPKGVGLVEAGRRYRGELYLGGELVVGAQWMAH